MTSMKKKDEVDKKDEKEVKTTLLDEQCYNKLAEFFKSHPEIEVKLDEPLRIDNWRHYRAALEKYLDDTALQPYVKLHEIKDLYEKTGEQRVLSGRRNEILSGQPQLSEKRQEFTRLVDLFTAVEETYQRKHPAPTPST